MFGRLPGLTFGRVPGLMFGRLPPGETFGREEICGLFPAPPAGRDATFGRDPPPLNDGV
ncbi:MAG: hypothetical protein AB7U20_24115 [Planctomycetaceae bacterium]